jgi:hypothetical protein
MADTIIFSTMFVLALYAYDRKKEADRLKRENEGLREELRRNRR